MEMLWCMVGFLAVGFTAWLYSEYLFTRRTAAPAALIGFLIGGLMVGGLASSGFGWLAALPFCGVTSFLLWNNYDCAVRTAVLHGAFLTFVMILSEELAMLAFSFSTKEDLGYFMFGDPRVMLLSRLCFQFVSMLGARLFTPHKEAYQEPKQMLLFCSLPAVSVAVSLAMLVLEQGQAFSRRAEVVIAFHEAALLVINLIFFVLYNRLQKIHAEKLELELSIQKEQADATYYQSLRTQAENQQILIHDIKNHLHTINELAVSGKPEQITAYISGLEETLGPKFQSRLCADPILNMLLLRTEEDCRKRHITFYCDVRLDTVSFMDPASITALYGNLLSNAVEAADSSAGRVVDLRVTRTEQGVVISVVNDCDLEPETDRFGRLRTRKSDPLAHGVGLTSIERVVQRFGGIQTMYYEKDVRKFHHVIHFPL